MANCTDTNSPIALLLRSGGHSPEANRLPEMLDFFGIPWAELTISEAKAGGAASLIAGHSRFSILTSAPCLAETLEPGKAGVLPGWLTEAASVFVYGFQTTDACRNLLREISGDPEANIRSLDARPTKVSVADDFPEICGPMSGVQMQLEPGADTVLTMRRAGGDFQSIVSAPEGHLFAEFHRGGARFFCDASQKMADIHRRTATYFDVKKSFSGTVPIVMYLKWAFRDICWTTKETSACLIIDDPLLQPRYGSLDFLELLQLMNKHTFASTIALIPWNWRRTDRGTVAAFQRNNEKLSICVHGCDHTGGEFATRSTEVLNRKLKTASHRMNSLLERTGLHHDKVMIFPQGKFSPEAGLALKGNGFAAAVNTEVAPANHDCNETTIADLWSVAILRYAGFAIFTRRYIAHGIENFAFDGLLGKPCFVVVHHELFRDHGSKLSEFLEKLNSLNWKLRWRTLGNAVCHNYSIQRRDGMNKVKMFAEQLVIENTEENTEPAPQQMMVSKEEPDIAAVKCVTVNQEPVDYEYAGGCLRFMVQVPPMGTAEIRCTYREQVNLSTRSEPISYKLKVAARRYLSEFRDK